MKRIYISGPITGVDKYMDNFSKAEVRVVSRGYSVMNPARVCAQMPLDTSYEEFMTICFTLLDMCDGIYLMDGWEESRGANREYGYALAKGMEIINL